VKFQENFKIMIKTSRSYRIRLMLKLVLLETLIPIITGILKLNFS